MSSDRILLVSSHYEDIFDWVKEGASQYDVSIYVSQTGLDGLEQFTRLHPILTIIDACLEDINGMSLASIIKDTRYGEDATIYLYNIRKILQNTKADFFFVTENDAELKASMQMQLHNFLEKRFMEKMHSSEIMRAEKQQYDALPPPIENNLFKVSTLFSPMAKLSGDCYDFWTGEDSNGLYGFLLDCTGHDIVSYTQVGMLRSFLKKSCKMFQMGILTNDIRDVISEVNNDLFTVDTEPNPACAVVFHINFTENTLEYCTAGIPTFYIRENGQIKPVECSNFPLGCMDGAEYTSQTMTLENIDEIIFSSDGFSELMFHNDSIEEADIAKHDDVSAVTIWLKRSQNGTQPLKLTSDSNVVALN